jgi:hypothetical protein
MIVQHSEPVPAAGGPLTGSTPGPWVSVAVPRRAYVSWLLHGDGDLVEVYIGGERTGGLYLTLPVHHLGRLVGQLRAIQGTVAGSYGKIEHGQEDGS